MTFTEDWFSDWSCEALAELAVKTNGLPGAVLEVGSWEGKSTIALASAVPDTVHAVDTWNGSPGEPSEVLAAERDVYAAFLTNTAGLNIEAHRMGWRDYLASTDGPLRFVFIDAEHSYEEVRDTIQAVLPRMVPGGIVCGDDRHHPPVQQAVGECLGETPVAATLWWHQVGPRTLAERYAEVCATPSDIYLHLPRLKMMVEELDATNVIELGTRTGVSTIAFLHALDGRGTLTSVDIDARPDIGEHDHWTFIQGDDLDPAVIGQLEPADIVFIDTSHLYEHTRSELNIYRWLVKPGGVIVCHDTQLARPEGAPARPAYPVRTAIEEFCEAEGFAWMEYPDCWGLGVIKIT